VTPGRDIRILGAALEPIGGLTDDSSRNAGLFVQLNRRYQVVGAILPTLGRLEDYAMKLRYFHPNRVGWVGRAGLNTWRFRRLSSLAEVQLHAWDGRYDLILMWQTLFTPGVGSGTRPYAVYTDNTYALTERYLPAWAPLSARQGKRWTELEQQVCREARCVFATSDFLRKSLTEDYGCDPARVIEVGAGTNSFVETLERGAYDSQVALFVGLKFDLKGGQALLRAWRTVRQRLPQAELWIAGPKRPAGEQPGVRWLGLLGREELARLYQQAAVFVLPSLYDPYPHAVREGMGHGLACIGTRVGGIPEMIDHERTGLLVEPEDPDELAEALISILEDPGRAEAMGREGHADILRSYRWSHVVDRMAPHIERVAAPSA
jgi:starch synthase